MADPLSSGGAGSRAKEPHCGLFRRRFGVVRHGRNRGRSRPFSIIGGALAANYFGPLVLWWLPIPDQFSGAVDFFIGLIFPHCVAGLG